MADGCLITVEGAVGRQREPGDRGRRGEPGPILEEDDLPPDELQRLLDGGIRLVERDLRSVQGEPDPSQDVERHADDQVRLSRLDLHEAGHHALELELVGACRARGNHQRAQQDGPERDRKSSAHAESPDGG